MKITRCQYVCIGDNFCVTEITLFNPGHPLAHHDRGWSLGLMDRYTILVIGWVVPWGGAAVRGPHRVRSC